MKTNRCFVASILAAITTILLVPQSILGVVSTRSLDHSAGVPGAARPAISSALGRDNAAYHFKPDGTGWRTTHVEQNISAQITDEGAVNAMGQSRLKLRLFTGNGASIADGDTTPSLTDHTDFGGADITTGAVDRTFNIENLGTADLTLTGSPKVDISGANAADFSVTTPPASPIAPSGNKTFVVHFDPSAGGTRSATISIANDDSDENPYDFAIQGTGCASAITVTSANDSGAGTLRQAIQDICVGGTITFDGSLSGATISLVSTLTIDKNLTIDGSALASQVKLDGNDSVRALIVNAGITASLNSLTITKSGFTTTVGDGGGIYNSGTLTLTNCTVSSSHTSSVNNGGGIYNVGALTVAGSTISANRSVRGGGIYNSNTGTLTVTNSTFSGNFMDSSGAGAAIFNDGNLAVTTSTFSNNGSGGGDGGIYNNATATVTTTLFSANKGRYGGAINNHGTLEVSDSTFSTNSASSGGGICNTGTLVVSDSTFSGNTASGTGGGIYNMNSSSSLTVTNSTFSANTAQFGGGLGNYGTLTLRNISFSANGASDANRGGGIYNTTSGTLNYTNTIIANSTQGGDCVNSGGTIGTNLKNLVQDGSCSALISGDPLLATLANNGGPTQTFALLPGSPAIDAGDPTTCTNSPVSNLDQRGISRPQGTGCDIGAYELVPLASTLTTNDATDVTENSATLNGTVNPNNADITVTFDYGLTTTYGASVTAIPNSPTGNITTPVSRVITALDSDTTYHFRVVATAVGGGGSFVTGNDKTFTTPCGVAIVVTSSADSGSGSLREAIRGACAGSTITFASALSGATISLVSTLTINKSLTIDGSSLASQVKLDGNDSVRALLVNSGVTAFLNSLTITRSGFTTTVGDGGGIYNAGTLTLTNCTVSSSHTSSVNNGGGIYNSGTLTLFASTVTGNSSAYGGGIYNTSGATLTSTDSTFSANRAGSSCKGGAIYNGGNLIVSTSAFSSNTSPGSDGGGIYNNATASVTATLFTSNSGFYGGAINNNGTLEVTDSTFSTNSASSGAGIANSATLVVSDCTFSGNTASGTGGGIYNMNSSSSLTVTNSTFSANTAQFGGGLGNYGTLTLRNISFSANGASDANRGGGIYNTTSGTLNYTNTIIANSTQGGDCVNDGGTIGTNLKNLVQDGSCSALISGDPLLATLANNGGPTQTFALLPGSPAIDAGDPTTCSNSPVSNLDQRGITRPQGAGCDIGAFESRGFTLSSLVGTPQNTVINSAFTNPLSLTVTSSFGEPVNGGVVTFTPPASGASAVLTGSPATIVSSKVSVTATANSTAGGPYNVVASTTGAPNVDFSLNNTATGLAPAITSANSTVFTIGIAGSFTVTTTGSPTPSLGQSGTIPSGLTFTDNGNGTATIGGTPTIGIDGTYPWTITAHNGVGTDATQDFTLTVYAGMGFYAVTPCRVFDTREPGGPTSGNPLGVLGNLVYKVTTRCGISATSKAIVANVTVVNATNIGELEIIAGNSSSNSISIVQVPTSRARANNATIQLATDGAGTIRVINHSTGTVHVILDVNGYFQ